MSAAVSLCLRAELRSRGRAWLVLALVIGFGAGLVLATAAGARRTESALSRHVASYALPDVSVARGFWVDGRETLDLDRVEGLPQVVSSARFAQLAAIFRTRSGKPVLPDGNSGVAVAAWLDERGGSELNRLKLLQGRTPRSGRPDEALVDTVAFDRLGYALGETVQLRLVSHAALWSEPSAANRLNADPATAHTGPLARVRIVGVVASARGDGPSGILTLPAAFYRHHGGGRLGALLEGVNVRLQHGSADVPAFERAVRRFAGPDYPGFGTQDRDRAGAQEPIRLQARVLMLVAGLGAAALLLFIAQAFVREGVLRAQENATLFALGMARKQIVTVATCKAAVIGAAAACVAVLGAILLSPLAPIGHARDLEASPGVDLDVFVLGVGAIALVVATIAIALVVALRMVPGHVHASSSGQARSRRTPAEAAARLGLPPTAVAGVRFALNRGTGATALPVRTTLAAVVLAVAVAASALTFARSLSYVLSTPRLYGVNFDYLFWPGGPPVGRLPPDRRLLTDPSIAAIASGTDVDVTIDGVPVVAAAFEGVKGTIPPATVIEGRAPRGPDEILLGPKTLQTLHRRVGDTLVVRGEQSQAMQEMRLVGSGFAMHPLVGASPWATGAVLTFQGLRRVRPDAVHYVYRLRIAPSADRAAVLDRLERSVGLGRFRAPPQIARFGGLAAFPLAFSVLFGAVGATMLVFALLTSIRRRRAELALLKTLGFEGRQVVATVAWQATTIAVVGLVVGLPLGTALARFGWNVFADRLAILPRPVIPIWELMLVIPITLVLANVVAAWPARIASRTRPAVALRVE